MSNYFDNEEPEGNPLLGCLIILLINVPFWLLIILVIRRILGH